MLSMQSISHSSMLKTQLEMFSKCVRLKKHPARTQNIFKILIVLFSKMVLKFTCLILAQISKNKVRSSLMLKVSYLFAKAPGRLFNFWDLIVGASSRLGAIYFQHVVCLFGAKKLINREDVSILNCSLKVSLKY